jgi:hypothetical protein
LADISAVNRKSDSGASGFFSLRVSWVAGFIGMVFATGGDADLVLITLAVL